MKKLLIYSASCILLFFQYACKKDLDALPKTALVDGNTITNAATAQIALNGVYYQFANINLSFANVTNWFDHEVPSAMFAGDLAYGYGASPEEKNDYVNGTYGSDIWPESYTVVNAANGLISGVKALPDVLFTAGRKAGILGEARFLRAYGHFRALSYFGQWYDLSSAYGILLRDEFVTIQNAQKARSPVKDSYDFILADLDSAIAEAPSQNPAYYATSWAAMALKMRVLMSRGGASDYTAVMALADKILQNSPYELEPNVQDIFYSNGLDSKEVILGVKPQVNQEAFPRSLSLDYYPGSSTMFTAKKQLSDLLLNDPRSTWMIGSVAPYRASTHYFTKFIAEGTNPTPLSETAYALRLTEVYLLRAEAIIRSGGSLQDARDILEEVMGHAGVTDFSSVENAATADALLLQVYYEISRNLVAEDGAEWMALLRFPLATVQQLKPTITSKTQYILPIPHAEFVSNPAIGNQNPGYNK